MDRPTTDAERDHLAKRHLPSRTPTRQEVGGDRRTDLLAEEADAIWLEALDFSA
jgi:hypothetical protein